MKSPFRRLSILLLLLLLLSACRPESPAPDISEIPWRYADLRLMDAPDAPDPGLDLIALYLRGSHRELQIRLDLLDLTDRPDYDLYLALDTAAGGSQTLPLDMEADIAWDTLVSIPASGQIQAQDAEGKPRRELAVWVQRNPRLDSLVIQMNRLALPDTRLGPRLQVFLTPAGERSVWEASGPARLGAAPPPSAQVMFAFLNVFPAYTPALALRRWDGAHTGPLGGRHGLFNLLRAARGQGVSLVLLDLKTPASLVALDYAGGLELVRGMEEEGLLILPEAIPAFPAGYPEWIVAQAVADSRAAAQAFGLSPSPFLYLPAGPESLPGSARLDDAAHRGLFWGPAQVASASPGDTGGTSQARRLGHAVWAGKTAIQISSTDPDAQLDANGLALPARRALVETAMTAAAGNGSPLLVLGGDLPSSPWGVPQLAREAFAYLRAHPWIQITHPLYLQAAPVQATGMDLAGETSLNIQAEIPSSSYEPGPAGALEGLRLAPPGPLTQAAWQAVLALYSPLSPQPPELDELRRHYAGQAGALLAASRWSASPSDIASCEQDPDGDGDAECILASQEVFILLELETGAISYAFTRLPSKDGTPTVHQLVAPSSQFAAGLSPASGWDLARGLSADPAVIPGAFSTQASYQADIRPGQVTFRTMDGALLKRYSLVPGGLQVCLQTAHPGSFQIPLALDPWQRFQPGWGERYGELPESAGRLPSASEPECSLGNELPESFTAWRWGSVNGPVIEVLSTVPVRASTFLDSRRRMGRVEDPNTDFPPGHYLPFPLALLEVEVQNSLELYLRLVEAGPPPLDP
jgi:hypothetical protein